jgi:hypothetical protein
MVACRVYFAIAELLLLRRRARPQSFVGYENRRSRYADFVDLTNLAKQADESILEMNLVSSSCSQVNMIAIQLPHGWKLTVNVFMSEGSYETNPKFFLMNAWSESHYS